MLSCTPDTLNPKPSSLDLKRHRRNRQIEGILHQRYSRPVLTLRLNGALSGAHGNGEHIHFLQCLDHRLSRHLNHFFQFPVQVMQSTDQGFIRYSCRANLARIRQSRPDSESGISKPSKHAGGECANLVLPSSDPLGRQHDTCRPSTTLSSKVNLNHAIIFRALCGAKLVTQPSKLGGNETLGLHRVVRHNTYRSESLASSYTLYTW